MRTRFAVLVATVLPIAVGVMIALQARAGGDLVKFPENYDKGALYAIIDGPTVDRPNNKNYRELWSTPEAIAALKKGQPIPSGTVLTMVIHKAQFDAQGSPEKDANGRFIKGELNGFFVMEKRTGWGGEYPPELRNGEWEYQSFTADKAVKENTNLKSCFACHKQKEKQDFVFSFDQMKNAK